MSRTLKSKIDYFVFGWFIKLVYPQYYRPKYGYKPNWQIFFHYYIPQKIFRLNPKVPWPVHFTSTVIEPQKIKKGILCDPGDNFNNYIQANNGIIFGSNVEIGPGVKIISSNHNPNCFNKSIPAKPITIGNHVLIGANAIILPEVHVGNNVIIGAGSIVTKDLPSNVIAFGNPCEIIRSKKPYHFNIGDVTFNQKIPKQYKKEL